jgi:hypothetical protein
MSMLLIVSYIFFKGFLNSGKKRERKVERKRRKKGGRREKILLIPRALE